MDVGDVSSAISVLDDDGKCGDVCIAFIIIGVICLIGAGAIAYYIIKSREGLAKMNLSNPVEVKVQDNKAPSDADGPEKSSYSGGGGGGDMRGSGAAAVAPATIEEEDEDAASLAAAALAAAGLGGADEKTPQAADEETPQDDEDPQVVGVSVVDVAVDEPDALAPVAATQPESEPQSAVAEEVAPLPEPVEAAVPVPEPVEEPEPVAEPVVEPVAVAAAAAPAPSAAAPEPEEEEEEDAYPEKEDPYPDKEDQYPGDGGEEEEFEGEDDEPEEALVRRIAWIKYYVGRGELDQARDLGWNGDLSFIEGEGEQDRTTQGATAAASSSEVSDAIAHTSMHRI